jgi:hypothetical protein
VLVNLVRVLLPRSLSRSRSTQYRHTPGQATRRGPPAPPAARRVTWSLAGLVQRQERLTAATPLRMAWPRCQRRQNPSSSCSTRLAAVAAGAPAQGCNIPAAPSRQTPHMHLAGAASSTMMTRYRRHGPCW